MSQEKERVYEYTDLDRDLGGRCIPSNDQKRCRYVYYLSMRTGVYQFDPISKKEKHFKLFKTDADILNKRHDDFLWTDDDYLVASSFRLPSPEMEVHFFKIQKEGLECLSTIQFNQFNGCRPGLVTVLSSHKIVLFNESMFGALYVWFVNTGKCLAVEGRGDSERGAISLLRFLNERSFLAIHGNAGIVCCWNILEDRLEKSWEFQDEALGNYKTKKSIHSDKIIFLRAEANFLTVLDISTGEELGSISNPNGKERKITVLSKINDDQILLCDTDGACRHLDDTLIYNIRTERVDYRVKRDHPFSDSSLNPPVCERFTSLSPTQVLVEGLGQRYLLSMEKDGVLTVSDFYRPHREYALSHVVNLGNGYIFSAPMHPATYGGTAPPTVLIKLKNFNNAIQNNISSRTWMAIALACLVKQKEFPVDLMAIILSFVRSGYETRHQLAKMGFFSHKLAICARDMVAKHVEGPSCATSAKSLIPKK